MTYLHLRTYQLQGDEMEKSVPVGDERLPLDGTKLEYHSKRGLGTPFHAVPI